MNQIHTSIDIDAPRETIWEVLTDFEAYEEWNPALLVDGHAEVGARLTVRPGPEAPNDPTFRPKVVEIDPERRLVWRGRLYVPGLFTGRHSFEIEDLGEGRSRLVHSERFAGVLVRPILARYGEDTERNFVAMNEALKARAEATTTDESRGRAARAAVAPSA